MTTFSKKILTWYDLYKRSFPWREKKFNNIETHAYYTWVCEVMSQQTLLSVLLPKYEKFISVLPDVNHLAECDEKTLRELWAGLGYYARARNLQKGAEKIVKDRKGVFPKTKEEWLEIPGCGPYTASIIASICYGEKTPAIDGNVIRVMSRQFGISNVSVWTQKGQKEIASFLYEQITAERPGDFNQALMDLGATVCKKTQTSCMFCPLANDCVAYKQNKISECPPIKPKQQIQNEKIFALVIKNKESVLLIEREKGFLKKTQGFLLLCEKEKNAFVTLQNKTNTPHWQSKVHEKTFNHTITHHKITGHVLEIQVSVNMKSLKEMLIPLLTKPKFNEVPLRALSEHISSSLDHKVVKILSLS